MLGRLTNWWPESHREIRSYEAYKGIKIRLSSNELKKSFCIFFFASIFFVKKGIIEVICHVVYFPKVQVPLVLLCTYPLPTSSPTRKTSFRGTAHAGFSERGEICGA